MRFYRLLMLSLGLAGVGCSETSQSQIVVQQNKFNTGTDKSI